MIRNTNGESRAVEVRRCLGGEVEIRHVPRTGSAKAHLNALAPEDTMRLAVWLMLADPGRERCTHALESGRATMTVPASTIR